MALDLKKITRSHEWWDHKTPQILSLAYATAILTHASLFHLLYPGVVMIFLSLIAIAIYASIINDFTDMEIDLACGKSNIMQRMHPVMRVGFILVSLGLVIFSAFCIYPDIYAVTFYLLIAISISVYSFPPFRLKKRGVWGVLSCAAAEHLFPTLFAVAVMFNYSGSAINWLWLIAAGILSYMYGMRSILWHQFLDRDNDQQSGISTYASQVNPLTFKSKEKLIISIELLAFSIIVITLNLMIIYAAIVTYFLFIIARKRFFKSEVIIVISPEKAHFQILMLDLYTVFFPLAILIYTSITQAYGWCVLLIHVIMFYKTLIVTLTDTYHIFRNIVVRKILN